MLRAVIFDLHGTLLDDEMLRLRLLGAIAADHGISFDPDAAGARLAGLDDRTAFQIVWSEAGREITPDLLRRLIADKSLRYEAALEADTPLFPGARALVEEAAKRVPVGVVASSSRAEAQAALKGAGLFRLLSSLVTADRAPPAAAYETCLEELGRLAVRFRLEPIPPRSVLAFEDTEAGIAHAQAAGIKVAAVAHTQRMDRLAAAETHAARLIDYDLAALERELF